MIASHSGDAYNVYEVGSHKNQQRGRSQTINNSGYDTCRSKSRKKNMECHYFHKKGRLKKDRYALKIKENDNANPKVTGVEDNLMVPLP